MGPVWQTRCRVRQGCFHPWRRGLVAASGPFDCDARPAAAPAAARRLRGGSRGDLLERYASWLHLWEEAGTPTRDRSLVQQLLYFAAGGGFVKTSLTTSNQKGRVAVPLLLWVAGVPFTLVFILWLFFFRGH